MAYMTISQVLALNAYERRRASSTRETHWWVDTLSNGVLEVCEHDLEAQDDWFFLILTDGTTTSDYIHAPPL